MLEIRMCFHYVGILSVLWSSMHSQVHSRENGQERLLLALEDYS